MTTADSDLAAQLSPEFELLRKLGEGTMASVYLAREAALMRLVAIKVLRPELAGDETARKRFEREGRSAARLSHPNVVAVYRVGRLHDGTPYLVMQYLAGRNLHDMLRARGPLEENEARRILAQLAAALAEAHSKGIIHRDVKPSNVVWMPETGRAVLMDFGIARLLETGSEVVTALTKAGQLLGDPAHRSPEQLRGEPLTGVADVYGLGVLGYELLAGRGPYAAASAARLAAAHLQEPPEKLTDLRPDINPGLARLLERCLAKKPEHRPDASELARLLPLPPPTPTPVPRPAAGAGVGTDAVNTALDSFPTLRRFLEELGRRRVFNVALIYLAAVFILLQMGELVLPALPLPEWTYSAVVALSLAGFPVAVILAWVFDIRHGAIHRTVASPNAAASTKQLVLQAIGILLSLVLAALIGWWILRP